MVGMYQAKAMAGGGHLPFFFFDCLLKVGFLIISSRR